MFYWMLLILHGSTAIYAMTNNLESSNLPQKSTFSVKKIISFTAVSTTANVALPEENLHHLQYNSLYIITKVTLDKNFITIS